MPEQYRVVHYIERGRDIFEEWLKALKDKRAAVAVARASKRIETSNFGEHKPCRESVWEIVIDYGPGYRIYYSIIGKTVVMLLCAGDKRTQQKDKNRAIEYLRKYKEEHRLRLPTLYLKTKQLSGIS